MAAKYTDVITTRSGAVLPGATVQLLNSSGALVNTYTDDALSLGEATAQTADANGIIELYVADGVYTVRQTYEGVSRDLTNVELYDISTIAGTSDAAVADKAQASAIGIGGSADNMGVYTAQFVSDNQSAKQNIVDIATALDRQATSLTNLGAIGDGTTNDTAVVQSVEASAVSSVYLPAGRYNTTLGFYDVINKRYYGQGQLILGGYGQARDRSFITTTQPIPDEDRTKFFDSGFPKAHRASYSFVSSGANPGTLPTVYTNYSQWSADIHIHDYTAGFNTDPSDHALGRSGAWKEELRLYHGGQGDLAGRHFYGEIFSNRAGATHWLSNPALIVENGNLGATSAGGDGGYLNHSEFVYSDRTDAALSVIDRVRNYVRTNSGTSLYQVWVHDRPQSSGSVSVDAVYSPAGNFKRILDTAAAVVDSGAVIVMKAGEFIYGNATATADPLGAKFYSQVLGAAKIGYNGSAWAMDGGLTLDGVASNQTAFVTATLLNSWTAPVDTEYGAPRYRKHMGRVVLEGEANAGANFTVITNLPVGFRPPKKRTFTTSTGLGSTQVQVWPDGNVVAFAVVGSPTRIGLDGVVFDVD